LSLPETSAIKGKLLAIFDGTLGSGDRSNNASPLLQSAGDNAGGSRGAAAASVLRAAAAAPRRRRRSDAADDAAAADDGADDGCDMHATAREAAAHETPHFTHKWNRK
jgi:hypothetical protein